MKLPFEFEVVEALNVLEVVPCKTLSLATHTRADDRPTDGAQQKIGAQRKGQMRALWRMLLTRKQFSGWVLVVGKKSTKAAERIGIGELTKACVETEEEVIEEQVRVRGQHKMTYKRPLEGLEDGEGSTLKKGGISKVIEADELHIKATEALSQWEARRVEVKVSPAKDLKIMLIEAKDG
ncbi:hypothetical protein ACLOJK_025415 [Asimina triloba]